MLLFDVNVYVHAHREDSPLHGECKSFLVEILEEEKHSGYSPLALSGFIRIVTHPKIFDPPSGLEKALTFCEGITEQTSTVEILPGSSHWSIFTHLIKIYRCKGNLIPDVWFAALAIEHGCTWVSTDRDYSRFEGLTTRFLG
jgi:hypothetical protein